MLNAADHGPNKPCNSKRLRLLNSATLPQCIRRTALALGGNIAGLRNGGVELRYSTAVIRQAGGRKPSQDYEKASGEQGSRYAGFCDLSELFKEHLLESRRQHHQSLTSEGLDRFTRAVGWRDLQVYPAEDEHAPVYTWQFFCIADLSMAVFWIFGCVVRAPTRHALFISMFSPG